MAHSVIFKPENSALVRSQGPEDSMPDSGKFKDLYLNSAYTYPCQPGTGESRPVSGSASGYSNRSAVSQGLGNTLLERSSATR